MYWTAPIWSFLLCSGPPRSKGKVNRTIKDLETRSVKRMSGRKSGLRRKIERKMAIYLQTAGGPPEEVSLDTFCGDSEVKPGPKGGNNSMGTITGAYQ